MNEAMAEYLPVQTPWMWALGICVVAASLEGLLSGTGVKQRFNELRLPPLAPPLWAWSMIGLAYYVLYFFVLNSLLGAPPTPVWTPTALALVATLLAANAAWNWVFFRNRDLWVSFIFFGPYILAALVLAIVLFRVGSGLSFWYLLYVGYLVYATWWGYRVWRLNSPAPAPAGE